MLYFFYGDSQKANEKAKGLVNKMLEKKPDAELFVIDEESLSEGLLQEMIQSSALFQNKYIVRIKSIQESGARNQILNFLKEIKESENIFVWGEGEVPASMLTKLKKFSEKVIEVGKSEKRSTKSESSIFEICNYLVNRDKKGSWTTYRKLLKNFAVEEIHGTIFWQFKNMAIATRASLKESGLAPFPYQNAKRGLNKYSEKEILERVSELSKILHESRSVGRDLEVSLERFILGL